MAGSIKHENIKELFDQAADTFGERTAVESGGLSLSYRELAERSNKLANFLIASGLPAGSIVAILSEDVIDIVTAIIGSLKAHCVFVPLEPRFPARRLAMMVAEVTPNLFVVDPRFLKTIGSIAGNAQAKCSVVCLRDGELAEETEGVHYLREYATFSDTSDPNLTAEPDDMCYVYFTSGSTGRPKGIAGRLKGLAHFIKWETRVLQLSEGTRVSQLTSPAFDPFLRDIFVPLCSGGTICIPDREVVLDPTALASWLNEERINLVHCVPSQFRSLIEGNTAPLDFPALKYILLAGEPLLPADVKRWMSLCGERVQLVNLYGPTETTLAKFFYFVKPSDQERQFIPVGKPMPGVRAVIMDEQRRPCLPGAVGEIYIQTPFRSLGYVNQPELTREVFIQNPFNSDPQDILYKTGDWGRVLEDGAFQILGRKDQQVKIRGMRIETTEIENLLRQHEAVGNVAVVAQDDARQFKYLCACVVLKAPIEQRALRDFLAEYLPGYMIPSAFVILEALPLTPNGKLDRKALTDLIRSQERRLGHLQMSFSGAVAHPEQDIADVPLLTAAERRQLLVEWNDTGFDYAKSELLPRLFEEQTERTPNAVAVVYENQELSYAELNRRANQLAHYLWERGVGPDVRVGVCLERSIEMVVGLLGILKAGGCYVPLDPQHPAERLEFMLKDAQVSVLLTETRLRQDIDARVKQVCLDADWQDIAGQEPVNLNVVATGDNLAYVIYTSGSTGWPKGAMNTQRGICNRLLWMQEAYRLDETDRVLQKTPFSFDVSVWEFFWPLITGATVVMAQPEGHRDNSYLVKVINQQQITTLHFVPPMLRVFIETGGLQQCQSLRRVICSGEALSFELQERFFQTSNAELHNLYGPTEAAVDVTFWACERVGKKRIVPIGRPIANTEIYVLDPQRQIVPIGVPGELHIGGVGLARGYLNRPDLTAEKFIPHPYSKKAGERLYSTGDLARYQDDGQLEFLGRIDQQVKIRGFRIELGEIEAVLLEQASVRDCAVIARDAAEGDTQLVAYVVAQRGQSIAGNHLRGVLKQRLPLYMIPSAFVILEALPLTPNGKLDRKALADLIRSQDGTGFEYVAPRNKLERQLVEIWQAVLEREDIGVQDNFFEIGGHSLIATRVLSRIHKALKVQIEIRDIFTRPTIEGLAQVIAALKPAEYDEIMPVAPKLHYDVSNAQRRLWILNQLEDAQGAYNMALAYVLEGALDVPAFNRAFSALISRHESLRTTFITVADNPMQKIHAASSFPVAVEYADLRESQDKDAVAKTLANQEAGTTFDLAKGPLLRARLLHLEDQKYVFVLAIHHIVSDGWSLGVLVNELLTCYEAFSKGNDNPLAPLRIQYKDYSAWQREQLSGERLAGHQQYWWNQFSGEIPVLALATDLPRPTVKTYNGDRLDCVLDQALTKESVKLGRQTGASLFMILLAVVNALLYRYTSQQEIIIGSPLAGRDRSEFEDQIGFYVNTLALRTRLVGTDSFSALVEKVKATTLEAYEHQIYPFDRLVDELQLRRDSSRSPLFDVLVVLQNMGLTGRRRREVEGLTARSFDLNIPVSKFDLGFGFWETQGEIHAQIEYNSDLFRAASIKRMLGHLHMLFSAAVAHPEQRIADLPLLTAAERRQLLVEWNQRTSYQVAGSVLARFDREVQRRPAAVALKYEEEELSYGELNRRANQLGHYLRRRGVGPEVRVGLLLERSVEMVVSVLAVLKAGGAYVPLELAAPAERTAFMLEDSGCALLLTAKGQFEPDGAKEVLELDPLWDEIEKEADTNLNVPVDEGNLAYVIYTSGSTGQPKGVMVTHGNVLRLLDATDAWFGFGSEDVWTMFHSYAFDFSVWELWGALLYGGRLVVVPSWVSRTPKAYYELLQREQVTVLNQTPSAFRQLQPLLEQTPVEWLRTVIFGGEALELSSLRSWFERYGKDGPLMVNMYGITETTVHVTYRLLAPADVLSGRGSLIGRRIPDLELYLLDERLEPVPVGVAGEIYVGGGGVARGYLNRAELTAERFIPHPFCTEASQRLYRTGDLGRYLSDGDIEYLGRIDQQVKIRGFRIELGEIEAVLLQQASVRDCAVVVRGAAEGDKQIVAYVVAQPGQSVTEDHLRGVLKQRLPLYMLPTAFVMLDALPLSTNGKVDRKALPAPDSTAPGLEDAGDEPLTPTELALRKIWAEVLRRESIGVRDNFFAIGGHSLLAIQVLSRVHLVFGVEMAPRILFDGPTIAELAVSIEDMLLAEIESIPEDRAAFLLADERADASEQFANLKD